MNLSYKKDLIIKTAYRKVNKWVSKKTRNCYSLEKGNLYLSIKLIVTRSPIKPGMTKTIFWTSSYKYFLNLLQL